MKRIQNHALHYSRELRGSGIRAEYDCAILRARTSLVCSIAGWYELSLFFFSFFFHFVIRAVHLPSTNVTLNLAVPCGDLLR